MIFAFFLLFVLLNPLAYANAINIRTGGSAPDFTLSTTDGKKVSLSEYKGKITVIIYWRTDQSRSYFALEDVEDIFKKYREKGIQFFGLVTGSENHEDIRKIIEEYDIDFPVLIDTDRQVYSDYGIRVYPTTVIVDREGKLAYDIPGHAVTYRLTLEGYLRRVIGEIDDAELQEIISPHKEEKDKSMLEAERRYNLALQFIETRLYSQAIESVKKAVEAEPNVARFHILLGFLFLEEEDADRAFEEFNTTVRLDPFSHDAKTGLGGALILKGDIDKALEVLNDAAAANPYPQRTYYEIGRAYELKGEKDKAIDMYKKALDKIIKNKILPSAIYRCQ